MNVSDIGSNPALQPLVTAQTQNRAANTNGGETSETPTSEAAESPQAQGAEGEAGSIINTYA